MGPIGCPKNYVSTYQSTPHNFSEERIYHLNRGLSLKSRVSWLLNKMTKMLTASDDDDDDQSCQCQRYKHYTADSVYWGVKPTPNAST